MTGGLLEQGRGLRLPLDPVWTSEDEYIQSALTFATTSDLFRNLCGGVHILDFLTREPDLYTTVLPQEWRDWFDTVDIDDVLDLLLRNNLKDYYSPISTFTASNSSPSSPPASLLDYVQTIRKHCLRRDFTPVSDDVTDMPRQLSVGMKTKKVHEVTNFAAYVDKLSEDISQRLDEPLSVIDFGSGQNYLGRTLASPPYNKHVVAIERKHHNIAGARTMDVHVKLAQKEKIMRNKKEWKRQMEGRGKDGNGMPTPPPSSSEEPDTADHSSVPVPVPVPEMFAAAKILDNNDFDPDRGSMTYIEHDVQDGYLENILYPMDASQKEEGGYQQQPENIAGPPTTAPTTNRPVSGYKNKNRARAKTMVVSLHSCGNLSHHALRSLTLNRSVCAVAIIGCCYNLVTERLGPASYKLPRLRPNHPRLEATGSAYDPHGFPLSRALEDFQLADGGRGVRLNITARMMAVQAPYNWGPEDSEAFFRRHFYRALLQRILLDLGVVKQSASPDASLAKEGEQVVGGSSGNGTPLIIGSLRKACFANFRAYVHGALTKLCADPIEGAAVARLTQDKITDEVIDAYERQFLYAKKQLAVIWSLMAFSAGVVESIIVADRWLFLCEQADIVEDCWVDVVFDYKQSPRNFVVVGIKKQG
ncbi:uncharacterized protein Z520_05872 [Fonsecaea multimorphosa CBS 102226]|uniref:Methyltransferase domain-containing protein n=1 Tax=Fonsecaea multimorphosa CBS 102226 TaxID=1442371 RepID=A0A0D2ING6_9EURO|nr:uncharacterized protein Z520_05872 [Fonsecaea multimorphosa CBS 102226]KIX98571.1 hypothetical protein Z520_05872 [Fonsecaea multimorphosa CBS 102226]OAL24763.1 hypothetical protein AYO22_05552 [Fonsecaea multimorphosa]